MPMAKVDFQVESVDKVPLEPEIKGRFLSVTDVVSWKLLEASGRVLYTGLIVSGPKPLPGGGFQCMAELILDMPTPIPTETVRDINNAVLTEFQKRAVFALEPRPKAQQ